MNLQAVDLSNAKFSDEVMFPFSKFSGNVDFSGVKFSEEKQTLFQEIKFAENTKF